MNQVEKHPNKLEKTLKDKQHIKIKETITQGKEYKNNKMGGGRSAPTP